MRILGLLLFMIAFTSNATAQNCSVSLSYTISGDTVFATATTTNMNNPVFGWYEQSWSSYLITSSSTTYFIFPPSGILNISVFADDTVSQCSDSTYIIINEPAACSASFYTFDSLNYTFFVNTSLADSGCTFQWDFGDGGFSYDADPSYSYTTGGIYTVCLYIWHPLSLMPCDTFCNQVQVTYFNQTGITENGMLAGGLSAWPNPTSDNLNVSWQQQEAGKSIITVTDLTGRMITSMLNTSTTAGRQTVALPVGQMPGGVYLLRVEDATGRQAVSRFSVKSE